MRKKEDEILHKGNITNKLYIILLKTNNEYIK